MTSNKNTCPCGLEKTCLNPYLGVDGATSPIILVIGEAPGATEDKEQHLFIGRAGQLLRKTLSQLGVDIEEEVAFVNVLGCRPPDNATPKTSQLKACSDRLKSGIESVSDSVKLILLLGGIPLRAVLNKAAILKQRGLGVWIDETYVLPTLHPAYVMRNPKMLSLFVNDISSGIAQAIKGNKRPAIPSKSVGSQYLNEKYDEICSCDILAFDTETSGLDAFKEGAHIIGVSLSWGDDDAVFVTLQHTDSLIGQKEIKRRVAILKRILENPKLPKVAHNGKFDIVFLKAVLGIDTANFVSDTLLAHHLLHEDYSHDLSTITTRELPLYGGYDGQMKLLMCEFGNNMTSVPLDKIIPYACGDAFVTRLLHNKFIPELKQEKTYTLYSDIVIPATNEYTRAELSGVGVDTEVGKLLETAYSEKKKEILDQIYEQPICTRWEKIKQTEFGLLDLQKQLKETPCKYLESCYASYKNKTGSQETLFGFDGSVCKRPDCFGKTPSGTSPKCVGFGNLSDVQQKRIHKKIEHVKKQSILNLNSPQQLVELFYSVIRFPPQTDKHTGNPTVGKKARGVLLKYDDERYKEGVEFIQLLEDYQQVQTIDKTFASKWPSWVHDDGLIHPNVLQHGTVTGRLAMRNPNLQNVPRKVQDTGSGITAWQSRHNIKSLFKSKFDGGFIVNADYSQVELRVMASIANDEIMVDAYKNGKDLHTTTAKLLHPDFDSVSRERQAAYRYEGKTHNFASVYSLNREYLNLYPDLGTWVNRTIRNAKKDGYTQSAFGRRRRLPELLNMHTLDTNNNKLRQAVNFCIQATAHEMLMRAFVNVNKGLRGAGLKSHVVFEVHDSLIIDCHPAELDKVANLLYIWMRDTAGLDWFVVPLEIDIEYGKDWANLKKYKNERSTNG